MRMIKNFLPILILLILVVSALNLAQGAFGTVREAEAAPQVEYRCVFVPVTVGAGGSNWKQVNESAMTKDVERALERLAEEAFELVDITPITRGRIESQRVKDGAWGGGFGMTQGVMITAVKR